MAGGAAEEGRMEGVIRIRTFSPMGSVREAAVEEAERIIASARVTF
jgi:hypothetical protein